jgi:hypothetical protein
MATGKLLGTDVVGPNTGGNPNWVHACRWPAEATGKVQKIRFYAANSGNIKAGIYAGDDYPATRLGVQNTSTAVTGGQWNDIDLESEVDVVEGTDYWILLNWGIASLLKFGDEAGRPMKYRVCLFADGLPPTFDSSWNDASGYYLSVAGWGVLVLSPSSTVQPISYGIPTVEVGAGGLAIIPTSIFQAIACGTPSLLYPQTIAPSSLVQAIVIGTPTVIGGETGELRIFPVSIVQPISIGSPTILKYVWHVILDGRYNIESPEVNRAYVIGRDVYGNPVYGTAVDSTELGLVGERLDFQQELAIPTSSQAESMASAILSKMRLTGKKGVILIPPNCGQELFDVVEVTDSKANQQAVKFRVVGIRFEYNLRQARYQQKLILGAP